MAYNVLVYIKGSVQPRFWLDLSESDIQSFSLPYRAQDTISFRGAEIPYQRIASIKITRTRDLAETKVPAIVAQGIDRGSGSNPQVAEVRFALSGEDLTDKYIPPKGKQQSGEMARQFPKEKTVFVAYGRDEKRRIGLFNFLRAIGLHPLEWSQASDATHSPSPTVMDIVQAGFREAQAIVILFTPDEEARLRPQFRLPNDPTSQSELAGQARPNVIFEAGMAWAAESTRTVLVRIGKTRPISDLAGVHFVELNNSAERRKDLVQRLMQAGCHVDTTGNDWLSTGAGDFSDDDAQ